MNTVIHLVKHVYRIGLFVTYVCDTNIFKPRFITALSEKRTLNKPHQCFMSFDSANAKSNIT